MLESAVESVFIRRVRDLGGLTFKFAPVHKGNPDRIVLLPPIYPSTDGRVLLVELKAEGGRLDPAQVIWHRRAAALGTHVVVLTGTKEVQEWAELEQRRQHGEDV